jgi:hypothetical protein
MLVRSGRIEWSTVAFMILVVIPVVRRPLGGLRRRRREDNIKIGLGAIGEPR